jgi:hypothetical protein
MISKFPKLKEISLMKDIDIEKYYEGVADFIVIVEKYYKIEGNSVDKIKYLGKDIEDILFIPRDRIMSVVRGLDNFEREEWHLKDMKVSNKELTETKNSLFEFLDVFYPFNPQKIEEMKEEVEEYFTLNLVEEMIGVLQSTPIQDYIYVSLSLYYLSLIMLPHAIGTRYPNNNHNPLEIYNKNLPLIQLFDELVEIVEKTLSKLGNLLTYSKDTES